jgi:hypothetical protein
LYPFSFIFKDFSIFLMNLPLIHNFIVNMNKILIKDFEL